MYFISSFIFENKITTAFPPSFSYLQTSHMSLLALLCIHGCSLCVLLCTWVLYLYITIHIYIYIYVRTYICLNTTCSVCMTLLLCILSELTGFFFYIYVLFTGRNVFPFGAFSNHPNSFCSVKVSRPFLCSH